MGVRCSIHAKLLEEYDHAVRVLQEASAELANVGLSWESDRFHTLVQKCDLAEAEAGRKRIALVEHIQMHKCTGYHNALRSDKSKPKS